RAAPSRCGTSGISSSSSLARSDEHPSESPDGARGGAAAAPTWSPNLCRSGEREGPSKGEEAKGRGGGDRLGVADAREIELVKQQRAEAESGREARQMREDVRVIAAGAGECEEPDAGGDRREPGAQASVPGTAAPRVRGQEAKRAEDGRRCADRAMIWRLDCGVQRVAHDSRAQNRKPRDARTEVAAEEE